MELLTNKNKYLDSDLVKGLFKPNMITHVDKVLCGNGFTTAFLDLSKSRGVDIIIFPNVRALESKQDAYNKGEYKLKSMGFIYGNSKDKSLFQKDTLCFVLDSFKLRRKDLEKIKISRILVDEYHTVEQGSSFRYKLSNFENYLKKYYSKAAIVTVTATPNKYSPVNVRIINAKIPAIDINMTNNVKKTIRRIKSDLRKGIKVVVFATDKDIIHALSKEEDSFYTFETKKPKNIRSLECNLMVGVELQRKTVRVCNFTYNPESNLTIISSNGFEGLDLYGEYNVYFFEKRQQQHRTFFISNLYQAINRCRDGAKYIEYSRLERKERKDIPTKKQINRFITREDISIEEKQGKKYNEFHKFVIFSQDKDTGSFEIIKNKVNIRLGVETLEYDKGFDLFTDFLDTRNITISDYREDKPISIKPTFPIEMQQENLVFNEGYIKSNNLANEDYTLNPFTYDTEDDKLLKQARKQASSYIILKIFDNDSITEKTRGLKEFERLGLNLLTEPNFSKIFSEVKIKSKEYYKSKLSDRQYREKLKSINDNSFKRVVIELILSFMNEKVFLNSNYVSNRDYNASVMINLASVTYIANKMNRDLTEIDIRSAYPRILYALSDLQLPKDFYGSDKKNKRLINVSVNKFWYNPKKPTPKRTQLANAVKRLTELDIDKKVIDFLSNRFFESSYSGDLFNFMAFHERMIINKLKKQFEEFEDFGSFRRHDSRIYVDLHENIKNNINSILKEFEYLNQKKWFNNDKFMPIIKEREAPF